MAPSRTALIAHPITLSSLSVDGSPQSVVSTERAYLEQENKVRQWRQPARFKRTGQGVW